MINNIYPGKFVVLEGLDGSGQSTQAIHLAEFLVNNGDNVIVTKEPTTDSEAGRRIKEILREHVQIDPLEFQKLFTKDREEHLNNKIIPALKEGKIVISDRYFFSSFAYGTAHGHNIDDLIELNNNFLYPDLIFFLNVKPKVCIERIEKRGSHKDLFEKEEKLAKVWEVYKTFPKRFKNFHLIDGERKIKEIAEEIKEIYETIS